MRRARMVRFKYIYMPSRCSLLLLLRVGLGDWSLACVLSSRFGLYRLSWATCIIIFIFTSMATSITPTALLALAGDPPSDPRARKALHDAARALVFATESPADTEARLHNSFTVLPLVKTATDLGLFEILCSPSPFPSSSGWTVAALAAKTRVRDAEVLHRVLRFLTSQHLIAEPAPAVYGPNHITPGLLPSGFSAGVNHNSTWVLPSLAALPGWLARNEYRSPAGSLDCAFQDGVGGPGVDVMVHMTAHPEQARATFEYMAWQKMKAGTWMVEGFGGPGGVVGEMKLSGVEVEEGRALLVDVGGGGGHQCFDFRRAFPGREGRMVVQDLEVVVAMIDKGAAAAAGIEIMAHDFYTPQPVNGAKVYYMRTVLHDWNDDKAVVILRQLRDAMAEDSVVVLDEIVVPDQGASEKTMLYDMTMLAVLGAKERSESQWRSLLEAAGLGLRAVEVYDEEMSSALIVGVVA